MQIIPAIDLIDGQVVRLKQGDFAQQTDYPLDPIELIQRYQAAGPQWIHVVDLDGARDGRSSDQSVNRATIARMVAAMDIGIQTGGGIRTIEDVEARLALGVGRVVIGSLCVTQPALFECMLEQFGADRLVAALDVRETAPGIYSPATHGWKDTGQGTLEQILDRFMDAGLRHCLCTDIGCDGMLAGPNVALYLSLRDRYPSLELQASGGVSSLVDIATLTQGGLGGVILGKSLLEGRFTVTDAMQAVVATQDALNDDA